MSESLYGVIEGFYGKPWSREERLELFGWMNRWGGLNTYMYAPKDDLLHRGRWRELYDDADAVALGELIRLTGENGIRFIYSIAPGLDMAYNDDADRQRLFAKIDQLRDLGCRDFAILFDDIPEKLSEEDEKAFGTFAAAHCDVSNALSEHLRSHYPEARLLFCPTVYCGCMADYDVPGNGYLQEVGEKLHPEIGCFWTGDEVISEEITVESIRELAVVLGRKPVIWDNLHANDYDPRRLYMGPLKGRSAELRAEVDGFLSNPNTPFQVNYIPLGSLARWAQAEDGGYDPDAAYDALLEDVYEQFDLPNLDRDFLRLFCDSFYLPFEFGASAQALLDDVDAMFAAEGDGWHAAFDALAPKLATWGEELLNLVNTPNRPLLHAVYGPMWMLREELGLTGSVLRWKREGKPGYFTSIYDKPGTYRGSFADRLGSHYTMDDDGNFVPGA